MDTWKKRERKEAQMCMELKKRKDETLFINPPVTIEIISKNHPWATKLACLDSTPALSWS